MTGAAIEFPRRPRGRPSQKAAAEYERALTAFCAAVREIGSTTGY